jgi:hypothetical protein
MSLVRIPYRVRQFLDTLRTTALSRQDLEQARAVLTDRQMALFTRLHVSEQAHSMRVMRTLLQQDELHPDLLVAALLHDVGKTCHPLYLWERVVIVIARVVFPVQVKVWGSGHPLGWRRPFVVAEQHPAWGAELVAETGASPLVVSLVRNHQVDLDLVSSDISNDRYLVLLQSADQQN